MRKLLYLGIWVVLGQSSVWSMGWLLEKTGLSGLGANFYAHPMRQNYSSEEFSRLQNQPLELRPGSFPKEVEEQYIPFHQSRLKDPKSAIGQLVTVYSGDQNIQAQLDSFSLQLRHIVTDYPIESIVAYMGVSAASFVVPSSLLYSCVGVAAAGWGAYRLYETNPDYLRSFAQNRRDWSATLTAATGLGQTFGHVLDRSTLKLTGFTPDQKLLFTGVLPTGVCGVQIEYAIQLQPVCL